MELIDVYPKKYQWLEEQKQKWTKKANAYFRSIVDKHNYEKLVEDWKNKCIESPDLFSNWFLNQPALTYYPEDKKVSFHFMHKPQDFGIEELRVVIDRYWEILKA